MKKTDKLHFIFLNQYVYQMQNRFHIFEQKNNDQINKITESIFCTSWSLKKYYFFLLRKKIKQNNIHFKYLDLLKKNAVYVTCFSLLDIENESTNKKYNTFICKKISEYFLLKQLVLQLKIKKYNYPTKFRTNKFITVSYKSNLLLLHSLIRKSFLLYFFIYKLSYKFNFSIMKNYYKRLYSKFSQVELEKKPILDKKVNNKTDLNRIKNLIYIYKIGQNRKLSILWLSNIDATIELIFLDKIGKIVSITVNSDFVNKSKYLVNINKNIQNFNQHFTSESRFLLLKRNKETYRKFFSHISMKVSRKYFINFYKSNFLILKSKIPNFKENLYFTARHKMSFNLPIKNIISIDCRKLRLIVPWKEYSFRTRLVRGLGKRQSMSLSVRKNCFCFKLFQINFKKETILISLDKTFAILKLKHFLVYLVFLKSKSQLYLNHECSVTHTNDSKHDAIHFLIKNLKIKSKYFLHFIIPESNNYFSVKKTLKPNLNKVKIGFSSNVFHTKNRGKSLSEQGSDLDIDTKANIYYSNLSPLQLTNLLTQITLNSNLFQYLLKNVKTDKLNFKKYRLTLGTDNKKFNNINFNVNAQSFGQQYPLILSTLSTQLLIRKKNINYLFFNILFSGISLKLKHYILIKNANRLCLTLNFFNINKKSNNVVKLNFILLNLTFLNLNSLPEFVWYGNQIVLLKDDCQLIYECFNILKKFLYLQGFFIEFSEIKLGHTLINYNKNLSGLDFLGFFIRQYKYKTNVNLPLPNNLSQQESVHTFPNLNSVKIGFSLNNVLRKQQEKESFFYFNKKNKMGIKNKWSLSLFGEKGKKKPKDKPGEEKINYNSNSPVLILQPSIYKVECASDFLTSKKNNKVDSNNFNASKLAYNFKNNEPLTITKQQRKFSNVLQLSDQYISTIIHPSKNKIKIHVDKLKKIIKNSASLSQENLIFKLSTNIRSWTYYYHIISNKKVLEYCDYLMFKMLWRWCCRRHPSKNKKWIKYKYFHQINGKKWIFGVYKNTSSHLVCLPNHGDIKLLKF